MRSRSWHVPVHLVIAVFMIGLSLTGSAAGPAQIVEPVVVFSALHLIRTNHIDNPDPVKLLVAALSGLRQAVSRAGVTAQFPDLETRSEDMARVSFAARFNLALGAVQGRLSGAQLEMAAVKAMMESLGDPFPTFISPEEQADMRRGGFGGIGIRFWSVDGRWYIWHVLPGGPAAQAGVRQFDQIVTVDGQTAQGLALDDLIGRIRGREGSTVRLTIRRPGQTAPVTLSIPRGFVSFSSVEHGIRQGGIGYIRLMGFSRGAAAEMNRALQDLTRQGIRALILDLRQNPGGLMDELDQIAQQLLPGGLVVYSIVGKEPRTQRTSGTPVLDQSVQVVVLVDAITLQAAEALAAAIAEHGRGRLVGMRTAGMGAVTRLFDLPGGGALWIVHSRVSTGKGVALQNNGVRPDVEVRISADHLDQGQDPQLERALQMAAQPR